MIAVRPAATTPRRGTGPANLAESRSPKRPSRRTRARPNSSCRRSSQRSSTSLLPGVRLQLVADPLGEHGHRRRAHHAVGIEGDGAIDELLSGAHGYVECVGLLAPKLGNFLFGGAVGAPSKQPVSRDVRLDIGGPGQPDRAELALGHPQVVGRQRLGLRDATLGSRGDSLTARLVHRSDAVVEHAEGFEPTVDPGRVEAPVDPGDRQVVSPEARAAVHHVSGDGRVVHGPPGESDLVGSVAVGSKVFGGRRRRVGRRAHRLREEAGEPARIVERAHPVEVGLAVAEVAGAAPAAGRGLGSQVRSTVDERGGEALGEGRDALEVVLLRERSFHRVAGDRSREHRVPLERNRAQLSRPAPEAFGRGESRGAGIAQCRGLGGPLRIDRARDALDVESRGAAKREPRGECRDTRSA